MGYFKKNIILTLLGILILIALFSCVSYFTFALSFGKKQQQTNAADLTISTLAELQEFEASVNGGNTYSGKTVVLGADINCGDSGVGIGVNNSYFKGTFNGNGKTISNYKPNSSVESTIISSKYKAYGLFTKVDTSTRILNLRVANSGRTISGGDYKYVGGIVGNSEGATIQNCSVENFTITTTDKTDRIYVSGIFAAGYATVTNCYVQNLVINNGCGASAGIGCAANSHTTSFGTTSFAWKRSNSTLSSCVVNVTSLTYNLITDTAYDVASGAYDYAHAITHCYNTANQTEGLDLTNTWYYNSSVNGGFPYLRKFMTEFEFDIDSDGSYDVSLLVPNGDVSAVEDIINTAISSKSNDLSLGNYGGTVSAAVVPGKQFDVWAKTGEAYHYQANYTMIEYDLVFNDCDFVTIKINNEVVESASFKVYYNTFVSVGLTQFSGNNGKYSTIVFDFYDSRYNRQAVKFEVDNQHYLAGYDIGSGTQTDQSITLTGGGEISLIAELRTYIPKYE